MKNFILVDRVVALVKDRVVALVKGRVMARVKWWVVDRVKCRVLYWSIRWKGIGVAALFCWWQGR